MQVKRNKLNEHIVKNVMNGVYPGYHTHLNGDKVWSLYKGDKRLYSHDTEVSCVSYILHNCNNGMSSTIVSAQFDVEEIAATLAAHTLYVDATREARKKLTAYLSSDEGAWGRAD